ncbi:hypothetical protein ACFQE0_00670 [Methylobacterium komagatae]|uniref:Uncharacterized protein n=1 Tax=Methylobacterium komagatae TaxID=374425 RepID=A0ABW2BCZ6_9HYPH
MTTEPTVLIAIPESVLNAVGEALERYDEAMKSRMDLHRDAADRAAWALEHYRRARFGEVVDEVRHRLRDMDGLSAATKAGMRAHISRWQEAMPRSKKNVEAWTAHKVARKQARDAAEKKHGQRRRSRVVASR